MFVSFHDLWAIFLKYDSTTTYNNILLNKASRQQSYDIVIENLRGQHVQLDIEQYVPLNNNVL